MPAKEESIKNNKVAEDDSEALTSKILTYLF